MAAAPFALECFLQSYSGLFCRRGIDVGPVFLWRFCDHCFFVIFDLCVTFGGNRSHL